MSSPCRLSLLILLLMLAACQHEDSPVFFDADNYPQRLSQWQLMKADGRQLVLHESLQPYDLATALFSDYALKLRTLWMPPGSAANYQPDGPFDFPVGTIITKTFYYPRDSGDHSTLLVSQDSHFAFDDGQLDLQASYLVETRLLVRQASGWDALPYVWEEDQQDALLQGAGAIQRLRLSRDGTMQDFAYVVPNRNECAGCHVTDQHSKVLQPLGPAARHLDKPFAFHAGPVDAKTETPGQLDVWAQRGLLQGLPAAQARSPLTLQHQTLEQQARAYLDINCGHCHQPGGSADTSGLFLHVAEQEPLALGICKPPVAAGRGTGGHRYSIVPAQPQNSILLFRMQSREPDVLMPELGRSLVHEEGVELLANWISSLHGDCL